MAITAANKTTKTASSTSSVASSSYTPAVNKLYICAILNRASGAVNTPSLSDTTGLNWVQILTRASTSTRLSLFRAQKTSGLAAGTLTVTFGGQTQSAVLFSIDEFTNVANNGTDGSGQIVQSASNISTSNATSGSVTLAAFADATNNAVYSAWNHAAVEATTPKSGYTELADLTGASTTSLETQWNIGQDTNPTASWAGSKSWIGAAVEIAIGGPSTVTGAAAFTATATMTATGRDTTGYGVAHFTASTSGVADGEVTHVPSLVPLVPGSLTITP